MNFSRSGSRASHPGNRSAFTMIEIALCLAIIGFGLVAIIGVLPTGMNVQKENREETIIDQDAVVWINTIRNGSFGYDDLTNHIISITNYWTIYLNTNLPPDRSGVDGYTRTNCSVTSVLGIPQNGYELINGARIVGLLSTSRYIPPLAQWIGGKFQSNYVVAYVRAMSGTAIDKRPQDNPETLESAFVYRMIVENAPLPMNTIPTNTDYQMRMGALLTNAHDLRFSFRWPILPNGEAGNGRQTFRVFTGGQLLRTNDLIQPGQPVYQPLQVLYFLQPSTYLQARAQ